MRTKNKLLMKITSWVAILALVWCQSALVFAADDYRITTSGELIDDRVLYSIGGGSVVGGASSRLRPNSYGVGVSWDSNLMCGNFDLQTTITNQLNGAVQGFQNIMGSIISAATGVVASLPALIIQRANPGLYELLSNGILQARIDFDRSKLTCEALAEKMVNVSSSSEWGELSTGQYMQILTRSGSVDAVSTTTQVEQNKGEIGIAWLDGSRKGGSGQDAIKATEDVVRAGYNSLHRRNATSTAAVTGSSCDGGAVCTAWASPKDATDFAVKILGESNVRTCQNCEPINTTPGVGLTPVIEEEFETRLKNLEELISGTQQLTTDNLSKVSSGMLPVSRRVIEALREDPDQIVLSRRLASELAMSSVLERALLLQRVIISGSRNPYIEQTKPVQETIQKNLDSLTAEINSIQTEMQVRTALANNTASAVLRRQAAAYEQSKLIESQDSDRDRVIRVDRATTP